MTFDGLVTSDDATYVIFEIFKVFLFETEALRALAQGESSIEKLIFGTLT